MDILDHPETRHFSNQVLNARRFHFRRQTSDILSGGSERVSPDYEVNRESVPFFAFEYVIAGHGVVTLGGEDYPLAAGTFFTYGPRLPHRIRTDRARPLVKFFFDLKPGAAKRLLRLAKLKQGTVWETSRPAELLRIANDLVLTAQRHAEFASLICERLLEVMLLTAVATRVPPGSLESAPFERYRAACKVIEQQKMPLRSLQQLAELCAISEAYLCRIFKQYDRRTPYQYLVQVQMNRAASLLRVPGARVSEVARSIGYEDPFHFSRVFRRHFAMSPRAYMRS